MSMIDFYMMIAPLSLVLLSSKQMKMMSICSCQTSSGVPYAFRHITWMLIIVHSGVCGTRFTASFISDFSFFAFAMSSLDNNNSLSLRISPLFSGAVSKSYWYLTSLFTGSLYLGDGAVLITPASLTLTDSPPLLVQGSARWSVAGQPVDFKVAVHFENTLVQVQSQVSTRGNAAFAVRDVGMSYTG